MDIKKEVIHVLIVGFHHKKGCQLEFSYPHLESLPETWKHLPSLAMPDGAHNFLSDTVYFHLPSMDSLSRTIFGVSCFQQIPTDQVKNKTEDMTRGTVSKAVCVLATAPFYGYIKTKLQLITAEYFRGGDFTKTSILIDAFNDLNQSLPDISNDRLFIDISVTEFLQIFQHRALLLYKLMLLERKVIFFHSPVESLCKYLFSLLSLHPGLIANGLYQAASASPMGSPIRHAAIKSSCKNTQENSESTQMTNREVVEEEISNEAEIAEDAISTLSDLQEERNIDLEKLELDVEACGLPLEIFGMGNLCFPYLSISYLDFLSGPGVRGFTAGATNVLFKQKRPLAECLVEIDGARIDFFCSDLSKQLNQTKEDIRFMDLVLKGIDENREPEKWIRDNFRIYTLSLMRTSLLPDGSKELSSFDSNFMAAWKNTHNFKMWAGEDCKEILKIEPGHPGARASSMQDIKLRISKALLSSESGRKLNQAVSSTGRAVEGAVSSTGRAVEGAVSVTGRVLEGAVNQAKGVFSGWFGTMPQEPKTLKATEENI